MRLLLLLGLVVQVACTASTAVRQPEKVRRVPLEKSGIKLKAPTRYEPRVASLDPQTNEPVYFDPKPQIVPVDEKAGKYAFKWIGYDGKEKTVILQQFDAIDAVVSATVSQTPSGQYLYTYTIENLPSSGAHLSGFMVQNFTPDIKPIKVDNVYIGEMSNSIVQFSKGNWTSFGILPEFNPAVISGRSIDLQVVSSALPGLVACRVRGGVLGLKGAGEHMPSELEAVTRGYEQLPKGFTIGPVDKLNALSPQEHVQYILSILPQVHKLGWITDSALRWYREKLSANDLEAVYKRAEQDLKTEQITTEVFAMLRAMK